MSKKRKPDDAEGMEPDTEFQNEKQAKRARLTAPQDTTLLNLPLELHERIILETIVSELKDRKILRSAWTKSADRVVERLRNVCPQWDSVLTTNSFQNRLHAIIDTFPQVMIFLNLLPRRRLANAIAVTTIDDDVYVLLHHPQQPTCIQVCALDDLKTVKRTVQLPGVAMPWDMVACTVNNCLYVLHQTSRDIAIWSVSKTGQQSEVTTCSNQLVSKLCVSGDGRLVLFQGPVPSKITVYNTDGSVQHQMELANIITYVHAIIAKSNGNVVVVKKTHLTEFDPEGNIVHEYKNPSGEYMYCAVDQYDRIATVDEGGDVRLLDSDYNSVHVNFRLDAFQFNKQLYRVTYNRQRNVFVAFETAAFCDGNAQQCLTTFSFTESIVRKKPKKKQN